jgi:hypothetical protein
VRITYRASAMSANVIAGTRIPLAGATGTWMAGATGGVRPYRFQWYRDGNPVGTDSAYTAVAGASDFELRAEITDAGGNTRTAAALIDVDGVKAAVAGPSSVHAAEGGSWSASGQGGYPPYTFDWYALDDNLAEQWVGSGEAWEGYPGDGGRQLRVRMTDSRGTTDNAMMPVRGFGGGSEACQPVPPQITCSS